MGKRAVAVALGVALACAVTPAPAQPADEPVKPWAAGVSTEARARALELYSEGNRRFELGKYGEALVRYREAIGHWDHPSIRFNIAVSLIRLDRPVEAYDNIVLALRFGAEPLDRPELFEEGKNYQKLLEGQLARLTVTCAEKGARVRLDGAALLVAPGKATRTLAPGEHLLVASKPGYFTTTRPLMLLPGKHVEERVKLLRLDEAGHRERRWAAWKPWAVVGGGALLALVGIPLALEARSDVNAYDQAVASSCPTGCPTEPEAIRSLDDRARIKGMLAVGAFIAGGIVVGGGVAMLVINQPRLVGPPADSSPRVAQLTWMARF